MNNSDWQFGYDSALEAVAAQRAGNPTDPDRTAYVNNTEYWDGYEAGWYVAAAYKTDKIVLMISDNGPAACVTAAKHYPGAIYLQKPSDLRDKYSPETHALAMCYMIKKAAPVGVYALRLGYTVFNEFSGEECHP